MSAGSVPIPVEIVGGADTLATLMRIANALESTGTSAADAEPKVKTLGDRFAGLASAARNMNEVAEFAGRMGAAIMGAADAITGLAAEQQRLDATSARLGLNFRQSAEQAGGFVSELQTMTLAASLADRGIRATQQELDALSRIGMSRAAATGKNLDEVFDSLTDSVLEGGEEMGKFGGELLRVADGSHTSGERLRAFVDHARRVSPAMRTAADEMARFRDEVHRAQRTLASAFEEEFGRLLDLPNAMKSSADRARDFNDNLRAAGMTAAYVVNVVGTAGAAALGFLVTGVATVVASVRVLAAGLANIRSPEGAMRAMERAGREHMGPDSFLGQTGQFTQDAWRRLATLTSDAPRTTAAPENTPTLASIREQRERDRRTRNRREQAGTPASETELARIEAGIEMAERMSPTERAARFGVEYDEVGGIILRTKDILDRLRQQRIALLQRQTEERRQGESAGDRRSRIAGLRSRIDELTRDAAASDRAEATAGFRAGVRASEEQYRAYRERTGGVTERARESLEKDREAQTEARERAFARSDEGVRAQAQKDRATRREERDLDHRYEQNRGFTERMEELSHRRIYAAQEEADAINGAFGAMGRAFSDHLTAVVEGREELGVALQGMLSDTLSAIAKESSIKAGLNLAEGFAALATYRYDAAAEHFAAAGIYTGVAVAAGLAGAALAPSTPDKGAGGGAAAREPASPQGAPGGPARGETVINVAFNGPQFGTGGVVQAARELVGVLNAGAVQGGVQINRLALGGIR